MAEPLDKGNATNGTGDDGGRQAGNPASLMDSFAGAASAEPGAKPANGDAATGDGNAGGGGNTGAGTDGGDGVKLAPWAEQLPGEMRENPEIVRNLSKYAKVGDAVKALLDAEAELAGGGIPGEDAKPEEIAAYWKKLGKPEAAEGYAFAKEPNAAPFAEAAYGANLTAAQAEAMYARLNELGKQQAMAARQAMRDAVIAADGAMKKEFGARYAEKLNLFTRGCDAAGADVRQLLFQSGLGANPGIIKAFIAYGKMNAESGSPAGGGAAQPLKPVNEGGWYPYKE